MDTLGCKIRTARRQAGLTQAELAQQLCVKNTAISNWENNLNKPDYDTIEQLCTALGVEPSYFFTQKAEHTSELSEYLDSLRRRPEMKLLFSTTKNASKQEVMQAVKIIEALRAERSQD